ncbi:endonuclease/exonuclease/phosphatase family protein [Arenibacterium sp. LLYu02]|uniref:endonuclease/exonuclease/phosphatase family protein n=1 Tax=Arenibacterium sp. LLYu02 TaxID=3404132 RepID=UPI003B20E317
MRRGAALLLLLCLSVLAAPVRAEPLRLATFNTELSRKGPGLLLRDLGRKDDQIDAVLATIVAAQADILLLQGIDWDYEGQTLAALVERLTALGLRYPEQFTSRPNAGVPSGLDLDGDGRFGEPEDAWGWGRFTGAGGMALLSRFPIERGALRDLTGMLWRDLPDHRMPTLPDGTPYPDPETAKALRLSSVNHWVVPIRLPDGSLFSVMAFHAAPPVFDGPEDRNGRRNADEILLWSHLLAGHLGTPPEPPFAVLGDANNDLTRGEGHKDALTRLLQDPHLQEPLPKDTEGQSHTALWPQTGPMRVDYILPSTDLKITASGILRSEGSRHGLIWVDISR